MEKPSKNHAIVENVTQEECFDRWKGIDWEADKEGSDRGTCRSDYDFDDWANEHQEEKQK